jgi:hypothetical protein
MALRPSFWVNGLLGYGLVLAVAWWQSRFLSSVWRSYVSAMARSPLLAFSGCFSAVVAALSWEFGPLLKRHLFMSAWTGWTFFAMAFMAYARALQLEVAPRHDADTCGSAKCVAAQPGVPR